MGSGEVGTVQGKEECMGEGEGPSESPIGQEILVLSPGSLRSLLCYDQGVATLPILDQTNLHPWGQIEHCFCRG